LDCLRLHGAATALCDRLLTAVPQRLIASTEWGNQMGLTDPLVSHGKAP
jgi:hypothetical protein